MENTNVYMPPKDRFQAPCPRCEYQGNLKKDTTCRNCKKPITELRKNTIENMDELYELLKPYRFKFTFDQHDPMFARGWISSFIISNVPAHKNDEMFRIMSEMSNDEFSQMVKKYS